MFNLQLELHIKNIWHAGHDKTMANFKSVAYVYNRCRSKYSKAGRLVGLAGNYAVIVLADSATF